MRSTVGKVIDYLQTLDPATAVYERGYDVDRDGDFITLNTLLLDMLRDAPEFDGDDQAMKQIPTPQDLLGFCSECTHMQLEDDSFDMNYTRDYGGDEGMEKRVDAIREGLSKFKELAWHHESDPGWTLPCACCGLEFEEQVNFFREGA